MEYPERREVGGRVPLGAKDPDQRREENDPASEGPTKEFPPEAVLDAERDGGTQVADEYRWRLEEKDRHIRELYDELAAARLAADEAVARVEAGELRVGDLLEERERLMERVRNFEEEERRRRRRREGQDRRVGRLEREIERREAEVGRLRDLVEEKDREMQIHEREARSLGARKESALEDALRRIEGLQIDLEERENEVQGLRATLDGIQAERDLNYEHRRRVAEPANRLRAGLELFNGSEYPSSVASISRSLGRPEVHAALQDGDEPPVILTFIWSGAAWRTYAANPGLAVEEPRVYQTGGGEDPSGFGPPNAHASPDGRVFLGL